MRVLIAEDEASLNTIIKKTLMDNGYAVDGVFNGDDALDYLSSGVYDVAILDVMMPGLDGFEVLARYRKEGGTAPVIFLTARDSIKDRVGGLDIGADDYLVKPFSFDELLARIRVVLRRSANRFRSCSDIISVSDLVLDRAGRTVKRAGKDIFLSSKEFAILEYMMINEGIVLDREDFIAHAWNYGYEGESNVIDVYIRYLRKKIDDGYAEKLIHTVRGTGYVLRRGE